VDTESSKLSETWDNGDYSSFCLYAANNPQIFSKFRQSPTYRKVVETTNYWKGYEFLQEIITHLPSMVDRFDLFRENDSLGGAEVFDYAGVGFFSPITLRYLKTLADLEMLFGSLDGLDIIEIGCGFGGQCNLILNAFKPRSFTLVDIDEVLPLIEKFLRPLKKMDRVKLATLDRLSTLESYDLIISNYAYTELSRDIQDAYYDKVLARSKRGYITYNYNHVSHSKEVLLSRISSPSILEEKPRTSAGNCIIVWGAKDIPVHFLSRDGENQALDSYVSLMTRFAFAPLTVDQSSRLNWIRQMAERGDSESQFHFALMLHFGQCMDKNDLEAVKWCRKAAEANHLNAQKLLGVLCYLGIGVNRDVSLAIQWFEKAAEQGDAVSQIFLGMTYFKGETVPLSYELAFKWFQKAADQGMSMAQTSLGAMYLSGYFVKQDYLKACEYFRMAAQQGGGDAQSLLADMYFLGLGVKKDLVEAHKLYDLASKQDVPNALVSRDKIAQLISLRSEKLKRASATIS
jgi:hypothetical protein